MSKQPPPAPTASAVGPYPTVIKIVGRPGTGSFPSTIAPPDHPLPDRGRKTPTQQLIKKKTKKTDDDDEFMMKKSVKYMLSEMLKLSKISEKCSLLMGLLTVSGVVG